MGNGSSSLEERECVGYRVLGVQPNSPASAVGLCSFFDFIVAANGVPLKQLDNTLIEMIKGSENQPLPITVYNVKSKQLREVTITPARKPYYEGMLGVTIRFDSYYNAEENLVRVLSVVKNSPAHIAGLAPGTDYLLGTAERVFKDPDALHDELTRHLEQTMEIYVYSTVTDEVRIAVVLPTLEWGGEGCLGAEIAHGYLHRLPAATAASTGKSDGPGITPVLPAATGGGAAMAAGAVAGAAHAQQAAKAGAVGGANGAGSPARAAAGGSGGALPAAGGPYPHHGHQQSTGVIDVDLSSTATQATAPTLPARS